MSALRSIYSGVKLSTIERVKHDNIGDYVTNNRVFGLVVTQFDENPELPEFIKKLKNHVQKKLMMGKSEDCESVFRDDPRDRFDFVKLIEKIEKNDGKALPKELAKLTARQASHLLRIFYREFSTPLVSRKEIPEIARAEFMKGKTDLSKEAENEFKKFLESQPKSYRFFLRDFCVFMNIMHTFRGKTDLQLGNLASIFCLDIVKDENDFERATRGDTKLIEDGTVSRNCLHTILGYYLSWFSTL